MGSYISQKAVSSWLEFESYTALSEDQALLARLARPSPARLHVRTAVARMAPHLTPAELDTITTLVAKKHSASVILGEIKKRRQKNELYAPKIWVARRAMAGASHLRGRPEKRGRSRKLSPAQTQRLFKKRTELISQADGERYVTFEETVRRRQRR